MSADPTPPTAAELAAWRELSERYFPHVSMPGIILRLLAHVAALTAERNRLRGALEIIAGPEEPDPLTDDAAAEIARAALVGRGGE